MESNMQQSGVQQMRKRAIAAAVAALAIVAIAYPLIAQTKQKSADSQRIRKPRMADTVPGNPTSNTTSRERSSSGPTTLRWTTPSSFDIAWKHIPMGKHDLIFQTSTTSSPTTRRAVAKGSRRKSKCERPVDGATGVRYARRSADGESALHLVKPLNSERMSPICQNISRCSP